MKMFQRYYYNNIVNIKHGTKISTSNNLHAILLFMEMSLCMRSFNNHKQFAIVV